MNLYVSLYVALLFVVLTPGILLTFPRKGSKLVVAVVHGLVFALVYHLTHKAVWLATSGEEGFVSTIGVMATNYYAAKEAEKNRQAEAQRLGAQIQGAYAAAGNNIRNMQAAQSFAAQQRSAYASAADNVRQYNSTYEAALAKLMAEAAKNNKK